ncbi:thiamine phosphate synthase [Halodurantibacterium flavum]|uniref:Thiamine phosphate synthase n=1 Tax=Halodurantibacterium flavum TaxID=1382802 RepID=A0ABW4SA77_9RHOB
MTLDRFYPIVDSADWVARLLALDVRLVQLRIKDLPQDELRREIDHALTLARDAGAILVVNDYWQLAIDARADWVHLGQEDLDTADIPALRRAGLRLGISTHDHAELDRALGFNPDYVALGPIFPTRLKVMKWAPQGMGRITEWKRLAGDRPLCAIGGLTAETARQAVEAGADMVAVVTDITLNPRPEARVREWQRALEDGART